MLQDHRVVWGRLSKPSEMQAIRSPCGETDAVTEVEERKLDLPNAFLSVDTAGLGLVGISFHVSCICSISRRQRPNPHKRTALPVNNCHLIKSRLTLDCRKTPASGAYKPRSATNESMMLIRQKPPIVRFRAHGLPAAGRHKRWAIMTFPESPAQHFPFPYTLNDLR